LIEKTHHTQQQPTKQNKEKFPAFPPLLLSLRRGGGAVGSPTPAERPAETVLILVGVNIDRARRERALKVALSVGSGP